eukprot:symbB.v1.2.011453.t1/scaffold713.1/size170176/2
MSTDPIMLRPMTPGIPVIPFQATNRQAPRPAAKAPWDRFKANAAEQESDEEDWSPSWMQAVPKTSEASEIIKGIEQDLAANWEAPKAERKQIMREYLRRWHPDKNSDESKETATAVIQFLYANKVQFLEQSPSTEVTPLLK